MRFRLRALGAIVLVLAFLPASRQPQARHFVLLVPPLENAGPREQAWLARAIADRAREVLMHANEISVIDDEDRTDLLRRLGIDPASSDAAASILRTGRLLGAHAVLAGTYRVRGATVLIDRRLIDCRTEEVIGTASLAGTLPTIFDLIDKYAASAFSGAAADDVRRDIPSVAITGTALKAMHNTYRPARAAFEEYGRGRELAAAKPDRALQHFMKAIQLDGFFSAAYVQAAAISMDRQKDPAQALEYLRTALAINEQQNAPASLPAAEAAMRLGRLYAAKSDLENAIKHYEDSRQRSEKIGLQVSYHSLVLMERLGDAYRRQKEFDRALECAGRAQEIAEQLDLAGTERYAEQLAVIASLLFGRERYRKAEDLLGKSLAIRTINETEQTAAYISLMNALARTYRQQNNPAKGLRYAEKGAGICRGPRLQFTVECAALMNTTGILHYLQQDYQKSVAAHEQGRAILDRLAAGASARYAAALYHLGGAYLKTGDNAAAGRCFRTAYDIFLRLGLADQAEVLRPFSEYYGAGAR